MQKKQQKSTSIKGFTLVEVLIAMVILSIGVMAIQVMQITSVKGNDSSNRLTEASTLASARIDVLYGLRVANAVFTQNAAAHDNPTAPPTDMVPIRQFRGGIQPGSALCCERNGQHLDAWNNPVAQADCTINNPWDGAADWCGTTAADSLNLTEVEKLWPGTAIPQSASQDGRYGFYLDVGPAALDDAVTVRITVAYDDKGMRKSYVFESIKTRVF